MRKLATGRRLETPSWAVDHKKMRWLLVNFLERRAFPTGGGHHKRIDDCSLTLSERLARARKELLRRRSDMIAVLDGLCAAYVDCRATDPERARMLQSKIMGQDSLVRMATDGPGVVTSIIYLYYGVGLDSVGVSQELQITPQAVRQTLLRLHTVWEALTGEKPVPITPSRKRVPLPPGTPRRTKYVRVDESEAVRLYQSGIGTQEIARRICSDAPINYSTTRILAVLKKAGVTAPSKKGRDQTGG